jgi:undecaprenyl diphosphate synthase
MTPAPRYRPEHVAIIMDGNGRWAERRGNSRVSGHKKGVESVKAVIQACIRHEVKYLTLFAFSSENWQRPATEVHTLMDLFTSALDTQARKLHENGVKLRLIGDLSRFSQKIRRLAAEAEEMTSQNTRLILSIAANYGGRWDIVEAARQLAHKVQSGELGPAEITEARFAEHLSTAGIPDPDLFIRTGGEYRISNFLLWQLAYAEMHFTDVLWPDFGETEFSEALRNYGTRERRFGQTGNQVQKKAGSL